MSQVSISFTALRAIGAEFALRVYKPLALRAVVVLGIILAISIWLTTLSAWWWILAGLVILFSLITAMILAVTNRIIKAVTPEQSPEQKQQVRAFVGKLEQLSEVTQRLTLFFY